MLAVNVYFNKLSYQCYSEAPLLTIETFISNLGGFFGLCMGLSFLSFIESIELVIIIVKNFLPKNAAKSKVDASMEDLA